MAEMISKIYKRNSTQIRSEATEISLIEFHQDIPELGFTFSPNNKEPYRNE